SLQQLSEACDAAGADEAEDCAGRRILKRTADELLRRMDGRWKSGEERYFYADFLSGSNIMLDDNFMPELQATLCVLPEFNVLARIRRHAATEPMTLQERMDLIYGEDLNDNNYGMADRILEYAEFKNILVTVPENAQEYRRQAARQCIQQMQSFRERYALDKSHGRVMRTDPFCNKLEETVRYWYFFVRDTRNYGFLIHLTRESEVYLHQVAQTFENQLNEQLEALIADNPQVMNDPKIVPMIREQIAQQRFNVAEDWMAQVAKGRLTVEMNRPEALEWLDDFMDNYAHYYEMVSDSGVTLSQRFRLRRIHNRDTKIASDMLENWLISGRPTKPERITRLLDGFGWKNMHVEPFTWNVDTKLELYAVTSDIVPTGPANPLHYIAEFGSHMQKQRTYVACIYGTNLSDRLLSTIKKLDVLDGNKILLVDCAVSSMDRRILAKELKQKEFGCRNTYLIVDRVLLCYLLERYQESSINRMLMALGMPFSYAQPYVVESSQTMPPEIFIGRKDELQEIIRPDGTNLIYGGRQLGKSALMKKARDDTDGDQGKRAVFVDIREKDCAGAALRLAQELRELNVIPEMPDTTDWSTLCSKIRGYLRSPDCAITYLLIMLDEADTFIADCANYSYRPLAELKDIQQSLPGRFKYVLAGLHDVVRFNREVALGHNSVITHMASIRVTPFHPEVAEKLLIEPMSYLGISFPDKVIVSEILAKTNYFPGLIQLYCEKLIQSIREINYAGYNMRYVPPYHVTEDHLKQILTDKFFVYQIQEKFEITLRLDAHYFPLALLMRYMYAHEPQMVKRGYTAAMILERARDLEIKVLADLKVEQINALMEELQDLNIFRTTVDHNTYLLSNKNFQDLLGTNDKEILDKLEPYIGGDK
ncbi:MAG: hypothetical protein IJY28_01580, partial [Clostridia bacterium]|nr:hypothetical protein [Clostridia bacterium]